MKLYISGGWEYDESYENNYYDEIPEDQLEELRKLRELSEELRLTWWDKFLELYPDAHTYQEKMAAAPYVDEAMGYSLDDADYTPLKVAQKLGGIWSKYTKASTRCHKKRITANSLNMQAGVGRSCEWVLRGYSIDGEDIETVSIDFQDDVRQAVDGMFIDPEIDTVDLYKVCTEYDATGSYEDEEYFETFSREDI